MVDGSRFDYSLIIVVIWWCGGYMLVLWLCGVGVMWCSGYVVWGLCAVVVMWCSGYVV